MTYQRHPSPKVCDRESAPTRNDPGLGVALSLGEPALHLLNRNVLLSGQQALAIRKKYP